jgi:hypothetical protein
MGMLMEIIVGVCALHILFGFNALPNDYPPNCVETIHFNWCVILVDVFICLYVLAYNNDNCTNGDFCLVLIWNFILIPLAVYGLRLFLLDMCQDELIFSKITRFQEVYFSWTMVMPWFYWVSVNGLGILKLHQEENIIEIEEA